MVSTRLLIATHRPQLTRTLPRHSLGVLSHLYLSLHLASHSHTLLHSPGTTSWTADSLLSQILSARTNLALGPTAKYQEAYYVYEEVKGMQGGRGETTLAGVSVAQALQGRWEESIQATEEALEMVRPFLPGFVCFKMREILP